MGVLDLPAPVFAWIDNTLFGGLVPLARLGLWALLISAISMAFYALVSPQLKLRHLKADMRTARQELGNYDGDFSGIRDLAARNIRLSISHLRLVAPAALAACIPVIMLLVWMAKAYGPAATPSGLPLSMAITGGTVNLRISENSSEAKGGSSMRLHVTDGNGNELASAPLTPALGRLEKRRWWHWLSSNRAGYLPPDAPIEAVHVRWPRRDLVGFGPSWLRGWEPPFLALAVIFSLGIQAAFRIE